MFLEGEGSRFIENYLPIHTTDGKNVIGVVEVYKSPIALHNAIQSGNKLIWVGGALGGIILFITLFWVVMRANSVIEQQERRLVASQTMAAVGELSSTIAHGFRNPLAALRSSAELALEESPNSPAHESLNEIVTQSDRLEAWIGDLLDGLRLITLGRQPVQVNSMIEESVEVFAAQLEKQAIRMTLALGDTLPEIEGNPAALHQVFSSVIGSMCAAMPDGGELHVSSVLEARDNHVHIAISSIGEGFTEDDVRNVCRLFVTGKGPRLGVGLALAQRIIQRDGGTLEFTWPPNGGTIANIHVPVPA